MEKHHCPPPAIMAILNVTPDSFYDGGKYTAVDAALKKALAMIKEGADIIDIGGESTGPGSEEVGAAEEVRRVMPIVQGVRCQVSGVRISVDTYKAKVARRALEAGASMVNDVTAGRGDPGMFALIAKTGAFYIMMRSKDATPRTTKNDVQYDQPSPPASRGKGGLRPAGDVMKTIHAFFEERLAAAERAGIARAQIILDPGLGHFVSSDPRTSWEILERLEELSDFGCPILVSPSRKSFTAESPQQPPSQRLPGTLKATRLALEHGASIIRTHDVAETRKTIDSFLAT